MEAGIIWTMKITQSDRMGEASWHFIRSDEDDHNLYCDILSDVKDDHNLYREILSDAKDDYNLCHDIIVAFYQIRRRWS